MEICYLILYNSLLSEKYMKRTMGTIKGIFIGLRALLHGKRNVEKSSSVIYVLKNNQFEKGINHHLLLATVGGGGVQRWLKKMQKYLADFGWEPILHHQIPEIGAEDHALTSDIRSETKGDKKCPFRNHILGIKNSGKDQDTKVYNGFMNEGNKRECYPKDVKVHQKIFLFRMRKFLDQTSAKLSDTILKREN